MDEYDIFEIFTDELSELSNRDLGTIADYALKDDWFMGGPSRDAVIDRIATVIYSEYFDSGAADDWGPSKFYAWYSNGAIDASTGRSVTDLIAFGEEVVH